jgi:prevent-host-death family protein
VILDHVGNAHRHGLPTDELEWNLAGRRRRESVVSIPIKDCTVCFRSCPSAAQVCPDCGHLFLREERDEQRRGLQQVEGELVEVTGAALHRPKPKQQQQRPRRTHPAAGCRTFEELLQREQERGYKPGWARPVWATRQRTTTKSSTLRRTGSRGAMTTVSATEARKRLYALIDEVGQSHEPVQITGKRGNAVLLSEDDWRAIQETLHLVSIPGMRESILEGMATESSELSSEPLW